VPHPFVALVSRASLPQPFVAFGDCIGCIHRFCCDCIQRKLKSLLVLEATTFRQFDVGKARDLGEKILPRSKDLYFT
jgi:hypothetical protein